MFCYCFYNDIWDFVCYGSFEDIIDKRRDVDEIGLKGVKVVDFFLVYYGYRFWYYDKLFDWVCVYDWWL